MNDPSPRHWKGLLPHRPNVLVSAAAVFAGHACVLENENAVPHLRVIDLSTGKGKTVLHQPDPSRVPQVAGWSPDGRWILYTQLDQVGSNLVLVDNFQ